MSLAPIIKQESLNDCKQTEVIRFAFEPEWLLSHFCPAYCKHFRTIKHLNVIPLRRDRWRRAALEMDWWKEGWWDEWQQENTERKTWLNIQYRRLAVLKIRLLTNHSFVLEFQFCWYLSDVHAFHVHKAADRWTKSNMLIYFLHP